jgi:hypothetical protein
MFTKAEVMVSDPLDCIAEFLAKCFFPRYVQTVNDETVDDDK